MGEDNKKRITELEFEYNGTQYRFEYDELEYKTRYGAYATICEIPISYTKYANNKEVIEFVCKMAMCIYRQGITEGKRIKAKEIKQLLDIRE